MFELAGAYGWESATRGINPQPWALIFFAGLHSHLRSSLQLRCVCVGLWLPKYSHLAALPPKTGHLTPNYILYEFETLFGIQRFRVCWFTAEMHNFCFRRHLKLVLFNPVNATAKVLQLQMLDGPELPQSCRIVGDPCSGNGIFGFFSFP